mmetsp:Transcript_120134/g.339990  ORF Transcript_120134/g.339990 Transcript_120134/m.339990 type:complete len:323 (+) Transcript_120134:101-1069(+)|eukprot:CAMPEP_0117463592 /NCGR_PEP_ID=MMETSP0784-20121206/3657_1 /TAXON_ID=39447 /ORGANISM="" /LENGTH=322 /DNA_ID=CAMNT_0005257409 /DNA_START=35 /DNA_END=1003 /DNA_ORIENTATION=+
MSSWEQADIFPSHVGVLLKPADWQRLRATHRGLAARLELEEMQRLFSCGLRSRIRASTSAAGCMGLAHEVRPYGSLASVLRLACSVDTVAEVLQEACAHRHFVEPGLVLVEEAVDSLRRLALWDRQLMPKERSGRRSSLQRRLLRNFAVFSGLAPNLAAVLVMFPAGVMPPQVFVACCEVLAAFIHNAKDSKRAFSTAGGISGVLSFLRAHASDASVQAAGLAALLALSARSVLCIRLMAEVDAHEVVVLALQNFPKHRKVVARATGLLANMSNVPRVCAMLQRTGALSLAFSILQQDVASPIPAVREFVQYMVLNVQGVEV